MDRHTATEGWTDTHGHILARAHTHTCVKKTSLFCKRAVKEGSSVLRVCLPQFVCPQCCIGNVSSCLFLQLICRADVLSSGMLRTAFRSTGLSPCLPASGLLVSAGTWVLSLLLPRCAQQFWWLRDPLPPCHRIPGSQLAWSPHSCPVPPPLPRCPWWWLGTGVCRTGLERLSFPGSPSQG